MAASYSSSPSEGDDHLSTDTGASSKSSLQQQWIQEQEQLKKKLILEDDFPWSIPSSDATVTETTTATTLRYLGGADISFSRADPSVACAALVVVDLHRHLDVVYEDYIAPIHLHVPYVPGFLAFREVPYILRLLQVMRKDEGHHHPFYPQILMVDGNGLLHPRGFGLACHLGVLADIPTIGIGKNLHHVDGLTQASVKQLMDDKPNCSKDFMVLSGNSGTTLGAAMKSSPCSSKPIFVSVGHRISLDSCIKVLEQCCRFRIPEPIRQADIRSRRWLHANKCLLKQ